MSPTSMLMADQAYSGQTGSFVVFAGECSVLTDKDMIKAAGHSPKTHERSVCCIEYYQGRSEKRLCIDMHRFCFIPIFIAIFSKKAE